MVPSLRENSLITSAGVDPTIVIIMENNNQNNNNNDINNNKSSDLIGINTLTDATTTCYGDIIVKKQTSEQQQQQRQQPKSILLVVKPEDDNTDRRRTSRTKIDKNLRIRFAPAESLTTIKTVDLTRTIRETIDCWYDDDEYKSFRKIIAIQSEYCKQNMKKSSSLQRQKGALKLQRDDDDDDCLVSAATSCITSSMSMLTGGTTKTTVPAKYQSVNMSMMGDDDFRGCESSLPLRNNYRSLTVKTVVFFSKWKDEHGNKLYSPELIARLCDMCSKWSTEVAFFQAYHDYARVYEPDKLPYIPKLAPTPNEEVFTFDEMGYKGRPDEWSVSTLMLRHNDNVV